MVVFPSISKAIAPNEALVRVIILVFPRVVAILISLEPIRVFSFHGRRSFRQRRPNLTPFFNFQIFRARGYSRKVRPLGERGSDTGEKGQGHVHLRRSCRGI